MAPAFGLALGLPFGSGPLGAGAAPLAAPYFDDFSGSAASISTGRTLTNVAGNKTWAERTDVTGPSNSLKVDGSGHLIGQQAGSYFFTTVELDTGVSARKWYRCEMNAKLSAVAFTGLSPYFLIEHSVSTPNSTNSSKLSYDSSSSALNLSWANNGANNGGGAELLHTNVDAQGKGVYPRPGDVFELKKYTSAGQVFIEPYYNGQIVGPAFRIDALGITLTDTLALKGSLPNTGEVDAIQVGDPAVHALLSVYVPRVPQINADGSCTMNISGAFTGPAPTGLTWTLYDKVLDTAVPGCVDLPVTSFAVGAAPSLSSDGSYTGKCAIPAGKVAATGAYVRVKMVAAAGAFTFARSCVFTPGQVALMYGQSLTTKMWEESNGISFTPPANGWTVDGSLDNNGSSASYPITSVNRKTRPVNGALESNLNPAYLAYQLNVAAGADKPIAMIRGGMGGCFYHERLPSDPLSTGIWAAAVDGVRLAGNDVAFVFDCAGEYEGQGATGIAGYTMPTFTGADQANLVADIQAIYDGLDAITGRACKVIIRPVGAIFTATDVRMEAMRRLQWKLTQDFPSRYILGCYVMDQQHVSSADQYHFAVYSEQARRLAWALAKNLGLTTFDRTGPKLFSVTAWSATSVTVRFDKNGASALEVVNTTGTLTDYRGGLTFATDSAFASQVAPTGVSAATNIDGTYAEITWTFAGGSFPTKPYVRGPYGFNPFNRTNNTTVNGAIQTQGSMVRGVFAGEDQNIPVQPYYSVAGDYIVGS